MSKGFNEIRKYHNKGVKGDPKAVRTAYEMLQKMQGSGADQALMEAYRGSLLALMARDAQKPLDKADLAQSGVDALNRAAALAPDNKEVRLLRANVFMRLPDSYFRCAGTALEDFRYLLMREKQSPGYLSKGQKDEVKKCIRRLSRKEGD